MFTSWTFFKPVVVVNFHILIRYSPIILAAFDTICPKHIKASLLKHGADPDLAEFCYNYITHRHLTTTIGGYTHTITVGIGFPQGGVCSAKFLIIAFNEAIEIINEYGVTGQGFADDCGPMTVSYTHLTLPTTPYV